MAASQAASLVAGIASLWLLARILSKEMFGGYAFAVAVIALLSYVATLGLDRSLLLRIARHRISLGQLRGAGLAARATLIACAAGGVLALGLSLGAAPLVRLGALPEAGFWLPALALAILPMAATTMLQAWFQANHRVPASAAAPGLADLLRSLLFAVVLASGLGAAGVAGAVTIAAAAPAAMLLGLAWGRARAAPRRFAKGDFVKGWQFLTLRLSTQGVRQVDLVMMGLLATGGATAEYAIAARIAILADYGRAALKPSFSRGRGDGSRPATSPRPFGNLTTRATRASPRLWPSPPLSSCSASRCSACSAASRRPIRCSCCSRRVISSTRGSGCTRPISRCRARSAGRPCCGSARSGCSSR